MTRINLPVEHAISIYLTNLKPAIRDEIRIGNLGTFPQAYYLWRL